MISSIETSSRMLELLDHHRPFALQDDGSIDEHASQPLETIAETLVDRVIVRLQDFEQVIPHAVRETLRYTTAVASKALKQARNISAEDKERIRLKIISAKLGGRITWETLQHPDRGEYIRFVTQNHLHHKNEAVGLILDSFQHQPAIAVSGQPMVQWENLTQGDAGINRKSFTFLHEVEYFSTDGHLKLAPHSYVQNGLLPVDPRDKELRPFDQEAPHNDCVIEVWTVVDDPNSPAITPTGHNHSWLVLRDPSGAIYSVGRVGPRDFGGLDYLCPLGKKHGGLESPDPFTYVPFDAGKFLKTTHIVTQEQFTAILERVRDDKANNDTHAVSASQSNCTSYVKEILQMAGIEPETKIYPLVLLLQKLLPSWLAPSSIHPAIMLIPPLYVVHLLLALIIKLLSFGNYQNCCADISWLDVFNPWRVYGDHPSVLRKWQQQQILNAQG